MNQTQGFRVLTIKSLAIIGFLVTLALCVWLVVEGVRRAPEAFSSLASIIESVRGYRPVDELRLTTEKAVVNSGETFEISWTDMKQDGAYHFSYTCTPGVALAVRNEDNVPLPLRCTEVLDLPASVKGLTLSITSDTMRLTDVPVTIAFTNEARGISLESETRITVANALIPVPDTTPVATTTPEVKPPVVVTPTPEVKPPVVTPAPKPPVYIPTIVYPQSDPNGYIDLAVTTLGSGVLRNGVFIYTAKYDLDLKNAIKFDIKNIGTKTSGTWTFKTTLPGGQIFESPVQTALKPLEHVEFTLGFDLDTDEELVKITNKVYTTGDANAKNDSASWFVVVQD
jgi:hypothetical protein